MMTRASARVTAVNWGALRTVSPLVGRASAIPPLAWATLSCVPDSAMWAVSKSGLRVQEFRAGA